MKARFICVTKTYGKQVILDNLSFNIANKSSVGLIGNNGCGKTTTINILCNTVGYNSGKVFIDNELIQPNSNSYKRYTGIVLSDPYFMENFGIREYLKFFCKFQKVPKNEIYRRIDDILEMLELKEYKKAIKNLSSGNQMKVSIAASLIHNPEFLIMDEPFVNLDIKTTRSILDVLKKFKGKKTIFITSHDLDTVADLCDEFLIMDQGKILMNLRKADFATVEDLKDKIRSYLVQGQRVQDIEWLN